MSNIAGKAYAMNVLTPSKPGLTWVNRLLFMVSRGQPAQLKGLLGLSIIHFARWVFIRPGDWPVFDERIKRPKIDNDYMLFCSNFNGTWDQYIDAFSDGIPNGLNLFWWSATKYPLSIPITSFKRYITQNQIDTDYYYNATPGSAQREIKAALRVREAVLELAELHGKQDAEAFAASYRAALGKVQNYLGEPGYGPVASLDTENADIIRKDAVIAAAKAAEAINQEKQEALEDTAGTPASV
ncbi:hypothetical protein KHP62_08500 [Rhodobacteraceae bacterium NNCM2]|nr:hypothetical protein [Coraliihabitans acroporae]